MFGPQNGDPEKITATSYAFNQNRSMHFPASRGTDRRANVEVGVPLSIAMSGQAAMPAGAPFAVFDSVGVSNVVGITPTPLGDFVFPPTLTNQGVPWLFLLADNITATTAPLLPSAPAPWALTIPTGIPVALQVTLQGVIQQAATGVPTVDFAITNAIQVVAP